ncbi:hypothetical protein [Halocalculus aciditolerans]|uniref:DUF7993 domain-containing protein n=1 Tax=Halocalculus aciditolerans TaxID=1383812 RepID=A0A830F8H0_9EURY|nr:hypothetical protein [Halocalculus aciditolerans]GGL50549.1 hypothetical protein GCM10009039_05940 [Halocalculus aciditolerans]
MVAEKTTDGRRLAQLLASELTGRQVPPFDRVTVENADTDAEPTPDGTRAYDIELDGERAGAVYMQPDRLYVDLRRGRADARTAAADAGLRVRPVASKPPRTLVFVADAAEVKRVVDVLAAALGE